jgi:hypothetical protein
MCLLEVDGITLSKERNGKDGHWAFVRVHAKATADPSTSLRSAQDDKSILEQFS